MKIYDKYKQLKEKDNTKSYLFKSGNFYIFLIMTQEKFLI